MSKNELKKRQKARQKEEEKAKKAAAAPPKPATTKKRDDEEEMDPRMYYENRSKAVKALLESSDPNPYPHKFHVTYDDKEFVKDYEHIKVRTCPACRTPGPKYTDKMNLSSPAMSTVPRSSASLAESTAEDPSASSSSMTSRPPPTPSPLAPASRSCAKPRTSPRASPPSKSNTSTCGEAM